MGDSITKKKGFEYYFTIGGGGYHYYDVDISEDGELSISHEYIIDTTTDHILEYLDRLSGEGASFYLSVHYTVPHSPWDVSEHPKKFRDLHKDCEFKDTQTLSVHPWQVDNTYPISDTPEKRKEYFVGYYATVSAMGAGVGKIMDWVTAHGLEENTVLIFTSDNGMNLGQHGIWGKGNGTYPPNMYDLSVEIPSIIKVPECEAPGSTCSAMAGQYGIFPTILSLAGYKYKLESLQPERGLLEQANHPAGKYEGRVVVFNEHNKARMIRRGSLRYIHRYGDNPYRFYDLSKDPDEETDLFGNPEFEEQIRNLKIELEGWFDRYSVPKMGAGICGAVDRGQEKIYYEKNAFNQSIELCHRS